MGLAHALVKSFLDWAHSVCNQGAVDVANCLGMHEVEKRIALALVSRVLY